MLKEMESHGRALKSKGKNKVCLWPVGSLVWFMLKGEQKQSREARERV